jgi:hypothetical protein
VNWRFFALGPPGLLLAALSAAPVEADRECVQFSVKELRAGSSFTYPLPSGLEFRLPFADTSWSITVGPRDDRDADFLAPVSPPFRSAPHRVIGPGYGVTAEDSVGVSLRTLRFVLNRHDAQVARDIASAALVGDLPRLKELDRLATGTLTLRITAADADEEVVRWMGFEAEACVPGPDLR